MPTGKKFATRDDIARLQRALRVRAVPLVGGISGNGGAGAGGGDHASLSGLGDDDHPQYILADGSRDFSGEVGGVDPTEDDHLATKKYVDDNIGGGTPHDILSATHSDTDATAPNDGDVLTWDDGAGKWKGAAPAAANDSHEWMHETFDALATGSIIGLGSYNELGAWEDLGLAAGSTAEVVAHPVSGKMLRVTNKAAAGATNSYVGCTVATAFGLGGGGRLHFKFKVNQNGSGYGGRIAISDSDGAGTTQVFSVYFRYNVTFQIAFWNGGAAKIMDAAKDTWYTIDAYWGPAGTTGGQVRICIDGTTFAVFATGTSAKMWKYLHASAYSPAGGSDCALDVDDLFVDSTQPLTGI